MSKLIGLKNPKTDEFDAWIKAGLIDGQNRWAVTTDQDQAEIFRSTSSVFLQRAKLTAVGTPGYSAHIAEWIEVT